jgi:beta-phosphoglucomutase-like phosphatase (HAD superfamily)
LRFQAVLFDCDGVLVDSEPITNGVLRQMLAERGWVLTEAQCMAMFVGKALKHEVDNIARHTVAPVTPEWLAEFGLRRNAALTERLLATPNIHAAVHRIHQHH